MGDGWSPRADAIAARGDRACVSRGGKAAKRLCWSNALSDVSLTKKSGRRGPVC